MGVIIVWSEAAGNVSRVWSGGLRSGTVDAPMRVHLSLFALLALPGAASAEPNLAHADVLSEIGVARIAEELGDAGIAGRLTADRPGRETLLAIRASPHVSAPEALVPALADLACGRHPVFAPEAAYALLRIGARLRPSELSARESLRSDLQRAHDALGCAARSPSPRPDIAQLLAQVAALLSGLLR